MTRKKIRIWIWLQSDNKIFKAVSKPDEGTITVYDENDRMLIKRTGLTKEQIRKIEYCFSNYGAKRMDGHKEPFTFL
ncbi:MAG: hypothetical protein DRN08_00400 [Thermoplasmata archaeon]|nr:MAG: hypothetical protein DRN05_03190 [Thermoplasmata archaeon]RLF36945.1 MAG: hypothetical protein DRN08_00400 [Thermoplasmata archaeon]